MVLSFNLFNRAGKRRVDIPSDLAGVSRSDVCATAARGRILKWIGMYQGTQTDSLSRWYTNSLIGGKGTQVGPHIHIFNPRATYKQPRRRYSLVLQLLYLPTVLPIYLSHHLSTSSSLSLPECVSLIGVSLIGGHLIGASPIGVLLTEAIP